jgi:DNA polymerase-1
MGRMPPRNNSVTINKKDNILIIDGNSLYKTGYHGAKDEFNQKGEHIGGIYQFITMLRKFLNETLYQKVYVFWDGEYSGKLRFDIYSDYKISRGKDYVNGTKPEEDRDQIIERIKIQEYLEELFIRQLEHPIVEADDFIAYYCNKNKDIENITIVSGDRDLCQLINENVRIYLCDKKVYVNEENHNQFFKYHKSNTVLVKMISGDSSDSIKGVKGVGEPTLIKFFPDIATKKVELSEVINKCKELQDERLIEKKKPLKSLNNIINGITDGVQGDRLYDVNRCLIDLSAPLLTEDGKVSIDKLMSEEFCQENRSIKNAYLLMKRDGIDKLIKNYSIEYLIPFKKLIEREKKTYK